MNAAADTLLPTLHTPQVRDVAWACFSPPMLDCDRLERTGRQISNCGLTLTPRRRQWLQELDQDPGGLLAYLGDARHGRLGLYFERLWQFFLDSDPEVDLVAHNLPVHQNGRTLGEFDCLYYCRTRQCHVHLELAVKFYLQRPGADGSRWQDWVGPNVVDRLDQKLHRLFGHQLRLGETEAGRSTLSRIGINTLQCELEIKGRLFPIAGDGQQWPPGCAPEARHLRYYDLDKLHCAGLSAASYHILDRQHWFAPLARGGASPGYGADTLAGAISARFADTPRPLQVAECDRDGIEQGRFFVVPADWPAQAEAA